MILIWIIYLNENFLELMSFWFYFLCKNILLNILIFYWYIYVRKLFFNVVWILEISLLGIIDRGLRIKFFKKVFKMFELLGIWIDI